MTEYFILSRDGDNAPQKLSVQFDPWDLAPDSGEADGSFEGEVIGSTGEGSWVVRLDRTVTAPNGSATCVLLRRRYADQAAISQAKTFPYISAAVYLSDLQARDAHALDPTSLWTMPGLVATVSLIEQSR